MHTVLEVGSPLPVDTRDVSDILVEMILQRSADRAVNVRAKALESLAAVANGTNALGGSLMPESLPLDAVIVAVTRRCADERPAVRKAALQAVVALSLCRCPRAESQSRAGVSPDALLGNQGLVTLLHGAGDVSTLVRRVATGLITDLWLQFPTNDSLQRLWLDAVLPTVGDREVSMESKGVESVNKVLLAAVMAWKEPTGKAASADGVDPAEDAGNGA